MAILSTIQSSKFLALSFCPTHWASLMGQLMLLLVDLISKQKDWVGLIDHHVTLHCAISA